MATRSIACSSTRRTSTSRDGRSTSRATHPGWTAFVESARPDDLARFGFPPPGDPVWTDALLDATARSPGLDLWRTSASPRG